MAKTFIGEGSKSQARPHATLPAGQSDSPKHAQDGDLVHFTGPASHCASSGHLQDLWRRVSEEPCSPQIPAFREADIILASGTCGNEAATELPSRASLHKCPWVSMRTGWGAPSRMAELRVGAYENRTGCPRVGDLRVGLHENGMRYPRTGTSGSYFCQ